MDNCDHQISTTTRVVDNTAMNRRGRSDHIWPIPWLMNTKAASEPQTFFSTGRKTQFYLCPTRNLAPRWGWSYRRDLLHHKNSPWAWVSQLGSLKVTGNITVRQSAVSSLYILHLFSGVAVIGARKGIKEISKLLDVYTRRLSTRCQILYKSKYILKKIN